jgi:hypothetical protein
LHWPTDGKGRRHRDLIRPVARRHHHSEDRLMPYRKKRLDIALAGLDPDAWHAALIDVAREHGFYQPLGDRHFATFIDQNRSLLVSFESAPAIQDRETALPVGFDLARDHGWSHLCFIGAQQSWFRDAQVFHQMDRLSDDGFFEDFDQILFYGAGPCGYAAAAFSVAAPGATVLALQPQATLDPARAGWDTRWTSREGIDFSGPYSYAPDMLDAALRGYILYNPRIAFDAMHAALFDRPHVRLLHGPQLGTDIAASLDALDLLPPVLLMAAEGRLSASRLSRLHRQRRESRAFQLTPALRRDTAARH